MIKKSLQKSLLIGSILLVCSNASTAGGQSQWASVVQVNTSASGILIDTDETALFNPDGCAKTDLYAIRPDNPALKNILASVLMAKAMGTTLEARFWVSGCVGTGDSARPQAVSIQLRDFVQ
ncbi:MAG: hypothetical protein H6965_03255 [Chromatiaceae bacterium]|nr:hypothetical protein [Chromatiaceae bacterium]